MDLSLKHTFVLIALDQNKGNLLIDALSLNYGIAGAILLELSKAGKIEIKAKKLRVTQGKSTNDKVLNTALDLISRSKKMRRTKFWINRLGSFKKDLISDLKANKLIHEKVKTILWGLIKIKRYPSANKKFVIDIKRKLKSIICTNSKPEVEDLLLLSLMHSCKLSHILFDNRKDYRKAFKRIKELTHEIEISDDVSKALKEVQAAVMIATTSAFVGASSVN